VPGQLSEEYQLLVEQGRHRTITVGCNDRQLLEPRPAAGVAAGDFGMVEVVNNPATAGVLVRRLDGSRGQVRWETELNRQPESVPAELTEGDWQRLRDAWWPPRSPWMQQTPELIQPAPDLDGDGTGDLVFVVQPDFLLAVSGAKGKPLWCRRLGEARTRLLGPPLVVADIDGDRRPDLISPTACFPPSRAGRRRGRRCCGRCVPAWRPYPAEPEQRCGARMGKANRT